ncbi:MAG TPA: trypsin-like peptidase domain-containing protein [Candidatus Limnocylindrales bacterium]
MRAAVLALVCAALAVAAVLGIGLAAGFVGGQTTKTVVVQEPAPAANTPAALHSVAPVQSAGFSPATIFARRSPGVVTVFSYFGSTAAQGSGFVVSRAGVILTNAHVITNAGETSGTVRAAASVYVQFADGDRVPAHIVGWDVFDDVGVLRVVPAAHPLVVVPLGRSATVVVGEPVAAIGSPLGNSDSLAVGIVSAVRRSIAALTAPKFQLTDAIQTDTPLAHGSSGGPLLDARGRAIGINAQIRSDQGGSSGIGFAVPIDAARRSLSALLTKGHVSYAYAGIQSQDLTPSLARHLRLPVAHGALVDTVSAGGPAAAAGLRGSTHEELFEGEAVPVGGDVIVAVDGLPVRNADDLVRIVTNVLRPGQTAVFSVVRTSGRQTVAVKLTAR